MADNLNNNTENNSIFWNIAEVGSGIGLSAQLLKSMNENETAKSSYNKLLGSDYIKTQTGRTSLLMSNKPNSIQTSMLSQLMGLEESSPLHILRTLQLSNLMQPLVDINTSGEAIHITARQVRDQEFFYRKLLEFAYQDEKQKFKRQLTINELTKGMYFQNGKLYGSTSDGKINLNDVILKKAKLVLGNVQNGDITSENQLLNKYANILKAPLDKRALKNDPLMVIGSNSSREFASKWSQSYLRYSMEIGFQALDNPLAGFEEMLHGIGVNHTGLFQSQAWQTMKKYTNIKLGTGGQYNLGIKESLALTAKNIAIKSTGVYLGYQALDSGLRMLSPEGGIFNNGLSAGLANVYASSRVGFAKIWSDRFQGYKEQQEQSAAGSTDLTTLLAFPLAGALGGAQVAYFNRIRLSATQGSEVASSIYNVEKPSNFLSKIGLDKPLKPMKRNALIGALAGATLTLPFLPGALIGESSKELEDAYSGKTEEAVRNNRFWTMGGNAHEGTNIKYFQKNWVARLNADGKDIVRFGTDETKKKLDPLLHPFAYLRDPYRFEKMHQDDMPYPIWGMDVSYGSFLGKAFERTVGQLIKPDLLNPKVIAAKDIYKDVQDKNFAVGDEYEGFDIDQQIVDFKKQNSLSIQRHSGLPETTDQVEKGSSPHYGINPNKINQNIDGDIEGLRPKNAAMVSLSDYNVTVEDADTVVLTDKKDPKSVSKVRLSGLDSPEIKHSDAEGNNRFEQQQLYGAEASKALEQLLKEQGTLSLAINKADMSYGRYVGVLVGDNNSNLNLELLRRGAASSLPWDNNDLIMKNSAKAAEKEAKKNNAGMWQYSRYQAVDLFNKFTDNKQTYNTLTALDKLAQRPELAAYSTYLNSIKDQKGPLTEKQVQDIQKLSELYLKASDEYKNANNKLKDVDISMTFNEPSNGEITSRHNLKFNNLVTKEEKKLVEAGIMTPVNDVRFNPDKEGLLSMYRSFTDFTGIKGWGSSLLLDKVGLANEIDPQLSRSGEAVNSARDLSDANLGDLLGFGEFQRKILGTSAGAIPDRYNPLKNTMATWLPSNVSNYYINFSTGNPYSKINNGEERLPGKGYAALHPELKGINPEDYPLIYKYKILSDVAKGSREHINTRKKVLDAYEKGELSKRDIEILGETLDQEVQKDTRKTFYDTKSLKDNLGSGPLNGLQGLIWNSIAHNAESPLEMLTPVRPAAKFLHQRTAIEDYVETQLGGPDTGIWTNPYSHFIKPTFNKLRQLVTVGDNFFIPEEAKEKYEIEEYFDKLEYLKGRRNGDRTSALKTVASSSMSGLNTKDKVLKFKSSLSDDQKDYFESFSKETNEKKREAIRKILPSDVLRGYEQIWRNVDIASSAKNRGDSVQEAIVEDIHKQTKTLSKAFNIKLSDEEITKIRQTVEEGNDAYSEFGFSIQNRVKYAQDEALRRKIVDIEASSYVSSKTKTPNNLFVGWDPRLTMDDIKIRTLSVGKEDLRRFGFWKGDEDRMNRMPDLIKDKQVVNQVEVIKRELRKNTEMKKQIENVMFKNGFKPSKIDLVDSSYNSIVVKEN